MSTIKSSAENLTLNADGSGNDISMQSNAAEKLKLTAEGNLHLQGSDSRIQLNAQGGANVVGNNTVHIRGDGTSMKLMTASGGDYIYEVNGSEKMRIKSGGNVGINISSPLDLLHLNDPDDDCVLNLDTATASKNSLIKFSDPDAQGRGFLQYAHSDDSFRTVVAGGEKTRIHSNGVLTVPAGIALGIAANLNTASNVLDDYEEGTWAPVLTDLSNNATMHALTAGVYTKIGRLVTVTATVRTSSLGSVSGNLYVTGFPYASANTNGNHGAGAVANAENLNITAGTAITFYVGKNDSKGRFDIFDSSQGITPLQSGEWSSDGTAAITATYST